MLSIINNVTWILILAISTQIGQEVGSKFGSNLKKTPPFGSHAVYLLNIMRQSRERQLVNVTLDRLSNRFDWPVKWQKEQSLSCGSASILISPRLSKHEIRFELKWKSRWPLLNGHSKMLCLNLALYGREKKEQKSCFWVAALLKISLNQATTHRLKIAESTLTCLPSELFRIPKELRNSFQWTNTLSNFSAAPFQALLACVLLFNIKCHHVLILRQLCAAQISRGFIPSMMNSKLGRSVRLRDEAKSAADINY